MPSPIGHALGGIAFGYLVAGRAGQQEAGRPATSAGLLARLRAFLLAPSTLAFAALGMLPDIDFLFGTHNTYTHSLGATLIVGLAVLAVRRGDARLAGAAAAAYGSHVLLDWLVRDTSPPLGIMALWPISTEHYMSPVPLMMGISRRYWLPGFWTHNLTAVLYELTVLGLLVAAVWWWRVRRR